MVQPFSSQRLSWVVWTANRAVAITGLVFCNLLVGCAEIASSTTFPADTLPPLGENRSAQAHLGPRLYVLDCGTLRFADVAVFGLTNDETSVRELAVPCYLIDHPAGRLLWDTGLPTQLGGNPEPQTLAAGMTATYPRSLRRQLSELSLATGDIDKLALSHMHFDHAGGANLFAASELLIQRAEYVAAFEQADQFEGIFDPVLYGELANSRHQLLDGDHDVFGDGSVRIVSAPGHTPGHQVLHLRLANTGSIVLSGDLYHFQFSRQHQRIPTFNFDPEQTRHSMAWVEALVEREQAQFWLQHDKRLFDAQRHSPAYYD